MGVTREDLVRRGVWLEKTDEEWERQRDSVVEVLKCYMKNDEWAPKINKKVAVMLTAWTGGLPFLKASLESHKKLGFWTVLAYDNFIAEPNCACPNRFQEEIINGKKLDIDYNRYMPPRDIMNLVDTFLLPHHQCWGGVSYPYVWLLRLGSNLLHSFDYVLLNNGDMVLEKPEGFQQLLDKMGDADLMSSGPSLPNELGTAGLLIKTSALIAMAKHMSEHMVPFTEYEKSTQSFGNTEGRTRVAVRDLGLREVVCKPGSCPSHPVCEQIHVAGGEWFDVLGMRHIHGELNYAHRYGRMMLREKGIYLAPPRPQYIDARFAPGDYSNSARYWELADQGKVGESIAVLQEWWAQE
jgi:hypothetical protein